MVSNDNVPLPKNSSYLIPIKQEYSASETVKSYDFVVPADKNWVIKAISMIREVTGVMNIIIFDPSGANVAIVSSSDVETIYLPTSNTILPPAWKIRTYFGTATAGWVQADILVEEEIHY